MPGIQLRKPPFVGGVSMLLIADVTREAPTLMRVLAEVLSWTSPLPYLLFALIVAWGFGKCWRSKKLSDG